MRRKDLIRLTTLRIRGVQNSAEFDLKCTTETDEIETGSQRRGTSHLMRGLGVLYFYLVALIAV